MNASSDPAGPQETSTVELRLSAGMTTRTSMEDTGKVVWHEDDHISVLTASANYDFAAESVDGGKASFTGLVTETDASSDVAKYAVYPYTKGLSLNGSTVSGIVIPDEQHFSEISGTSVSFAQNTNPSIGSVSADNQIMFYNLCGLVRVKINTQSSITKITLRGKQNDAIAGTGAADAASEAPAWTAAAAKQSIVLTKTDASAFAADGVTFTFVVAPVTFENGLEIVLENDQNGAYTWTSGKNITINRAKYKSFEITAKAGDFEEVVPMPENAWSYYYGADGNCLLVKPGQTSGTLDVQPYVVRTDCKITSERYPAPKAKGCKVLWTETGLSLDAAVSDDYKTLTVSNITGFGNASVAIYADADCSGDILWSYHIWVPEVDPTDGLLEYTVDHTGGDGSIPAPSVRTYRLMPMYLGATKIANKESSTDERLASIGCYYQWGRKDPLGRPSSFINGQLKFRSTEGTDWPEKMRAEIVEGATGALDLVSIDYTIKNPDHFITIPDKQWPENDPDLYLAWTGMQNTNLWGNPTDNYTFVTGKSCYDPCPKGYRVAAADTWWNVTSHHWQSGNADEILSDTSLSEINDLGFNYLYAGKENTDKTDFYVVSGSRDHRGGGSVWSEIAVFSSGLSCDSSQPDYVAEGFFVGWVAHPRYPYPMSDGKCIRCVKYEE